MASPAYSTHYGPCQIDEGGLHARQHVWTMMVHIADHRRRCGSCDIVLDEHPILDTRQYPVLSLRRRTTITSVHSLAPRDSDSLGVDGRVRRCSLPSLRRCRFDFQTRRAGDTLNLIACLARFPDSHHDVGSVHGWLRVGRALRAPTPTPTSQFLAFPSSASSSVGSSAGMAVANSSTSPSSEPSTPAGCSSSS